MGMIKYSQSTQSNKLLCQNMSILEQQYVKIEVRDGFLFQHADKRQSFYKLELLFFMKVTRHVQCTLNRNLIIILQYVKKKLSQLFLCFVVMQSIQVFYEAPVIFVVTCFMSVLPSSLRSDAISNQTELFLSVTFLRMLELTTTLQGRIQEPAKNIYDGAFSKKYLTAFNRLLFSQESSIIEACRIYNINRDMETYQLRTTFKFLMELCSRFLIDHEFSGSSRVLLLTIKLPNTMSHYRNGSVCYLNALHERSSQFKPSCDHLNLQSFTVSHLYRKYL